MTKPARPSHEVEEIRERILKCALEILIDEGYDKLSMRKIATRSGMSATNLYYYFSKKDEIYISIVIRGFKQLHERFQEIHGNASTVRERARALVRAYIDFSNSHRHYYEIMFTRPTPKYKEYIGTPFEKLAAVELDYSMKIVSIAGETVAEMLQLDPSQSDVIKAKVMEVLSLLHGMVSLLNSNIAEYMIDDWDSFVDSVVEGLVPEA